MGSILGTDELLSTLALETSLNRVYLRTLEVSTLELISVRGRHIQIASIRCASYV